MAGKEKSGNVFASKNFRLVFLGALVSELGALLYSFAVSFYILDISGNNAFPQGLYLALCGVALLIFTPIGGVLGDRYNKAKIMFLCDYMKGGMIILATILMLLFRKPNAQIVILFCLGIIGNAVSGIFNPAAGALFPHIVDEDKLQQANAYFTIKSSLEGILGVILAGILYAALPIHTLFFLVGFCFVASGISEMFIRYEHHPSEEALTLRLAASSVYIFNGTDENPTALTPAFPKAVGEEEEMANGKQLNGKCFDLSGRRLAKPQEKRINIIAGKKILSGGKGH